jgi:hypothetical protein
MIGGWVTGKSVAQGMRLPRDESMKASRRLFWVRIRKPCLPSSFASTVSSNADRTVRITKAEYERVRSDPRQFVIFEGHLIPDIEQIVFEGDSSSSRSVRHPGRGALREDPET